MIIFRGKVTPARPGTSKSIQAIRSVINTGYFLGRHIFLIDFFLVDIYWIDIERL